MRLHARKAKEKCTATAHPKWKWLSEMDAKMALANIAAKPGSQGVRSMGGQPKEGRVYHCRTCNCWHTTHMPALKSA